MDNIYKIHLDTIKRDLLSLTLYICRSHDFLSFYQWRNQLFKINWEAHSTLSVVTIIVIASQSVWKRTGLVTSGIQFYIEDGAYLSTSFVESQFSL